jgi:hypothetical protein
MLASSHFYILQFNCKEVKSSAVELAAYLAENNVVVAYLQDTKLLAAPCSPFFPGYALEQRHLPGGLGFSLVIFICLNVPYTWQDIFPLLRGNTTKETIAISTSLNGSPLCIICLHPTVLLLPLDILWSLQILSPSWVTA